MVTSILSFLLFTIFVVSAFADRFNTTAQPWMWATGTSSELREFAMSEEMRPVDVEVISLEPRRYAMVFVDNPPPNNVTWFWYEGLNFRSLQKRARKDESRVIDLETVFPPDQIPEAEHIALAVSNTGKQARLWYYFANVPASQISGIVEARNAKIVDLDTYFPNFIIKRLYSFVLLPNVGVDKAKSFFFYNKKVAYIERMLEKRGARLVDIEREEEGVYSGVMEKMEMPVKWYWFRGLSAKEIDNVSEKRMLRVYDLEPYKMGGKIMYDALMINNERK